MAWWPGKIESNSTSHAIASVVDLSPDYPYQAKLEKDDKIERDGLNISVYLFGPEKLREASPFFNW